MSTPEVELRSVWQHLVGPDGSKPLEHLLESLLARHREPHRRYHTATHVMWVVRHIDHIAAAGLPSSVDLPAVRLAALFHDAVYNTQRNDNEAVSAELGARAAADLGWPADRCDTVHRLVLATAAHAPSAPDEAVLVDADLAILGAEPKDYAAYVQGVRFEYLHVRPELWRRGRALVVRHFLELPVLFHTEVMHRELESRAKANLAAELAGLEPTIG